MRFKIVVSIALAVSLGLNAYALFRVHALEQSIPSSIYDLGWEHSPPAQELSQAVDRLDRHGNKIDYLSETQSEICEALRGSC